MYKFILLVIKFYECSLEDLRMTNEVVVKLRVSSNIETHIIMQMSHSRYL